MRLVRNIYTQIYHIWLAVLYNSMHYHCPRRPDLRLVTEGPSITDAVLLIP